MCSLPGGCRHQHCQSHSVFLSCRRMSPPTLPVSFCVSLFQEDVATNIASLILCFSIPGGCRHQHCQSHSVFLYSRRMSPPTLPVSFCVSLFQEDVATNIASLILCFSIPGGCRHQHCQSHSVFLSSRRMSPPTLPVSFCVSLFQEDVATNMASLILCFSIPGGCRHQHCQSHSVFLYSRRMSPPTLPVSFCVSLFQEDVATNIASLILCFSIPGGCRHQHCQSHSVFLYSRRMSPPTLPVSFCVSLLQEDVATNIASLILCFSIPGGCRHQHCQSHSVFLYSRRMSPPTLPVSFCVSLFQEDVATNIASLILCFSHIDTSLVFIKAFFKTISREWNLIDRQRLDKFMTVSISMVHWPAGLEICGILVANAT